MFHSNKSKLHTRIDFAVLRVRELFQFPLPPPPSFAKATDGRPSGMPCVDFFLRKQKKRSATERAKDALHSSESGGGLCGCELQ